MVTMKTAPTDKSKTRVARRLAAEDVRIGDFVALLYESCEVPSFMWCGDAQLTGRDQMVPLRYRSSRGGIPHKVKAICLPFVFVRPPDGQCFSLDLRQCELVRLPKRYGKFVWKRLKKTHRRRK